MGLAAIVFCRATGTTIVKSDSPPNKVKVKPASKFSMEKAKSYWHKQMCQTVAVAVMVGLFRTFRNARLI
jgi:hypothetical protein